MREATAFDVEIEDDVISVSASIGVALFPQHAAEPHALLKLADEAMYAAKRNGKNTFCFYSATDRGTGSSAERESPASAERESSPSARRKKRTAGEPRSPGAATAER
jgi:hypothetical protein